MIAGDPWFVAGDVCRALGLSMLKGAAQHMRLVASDERMLVVKRGVDPRSESGCLFVGSDSSHSLVSESGLYKLVMRSEKATARAFQDWVTREVLPSIRKTGGYLINESARQTAVADSRGSFPMASSSKTPLLAPKARNALALVQLPNVRVKEVGGHPTVDLIIVKGLRCIESSPVYAQRLALRSRDRRVPIKRVGRPDVATG